MNRRSVLAAVVSAGLLIATVVITKPYTIRPLDETGKAKKEVQFDPVSYVNSMWEEKVVPTARNEAVEATQLLGALAADKAKAQETYGRQASGGGPYSFLVKGTGRVLSEEAGSLAVDLLPGDGKADLVVRVGQVITGTAIRDAMSFIEFGAFKNVLEYADVAKELNNRVKATVVNGFDAKAAVGKQIEFHGAFALSDPANITVIPIQLDVQN